MNPSPSLRTQIVHSHSVYHIVILYFYDSDKCYLFVLSKLLDLGLICFFFQTHSLLINVALRLT